MLSLIFCCLPHKLDQLSSIILWISPAAMNLPISSKYSTWKWRFFLSFFFFLAGYLQDLVYKLSKVGQAIDNNDLSTASSVLGGSTNIDWIKNANVAFTKVTPAP